MPQIIVEYSADIADSFDRQAFATALHPAASAIVGSEINAFKTRFYPIKDSVIGDGNPRHAMIAVLASILSGRDEATKAELGKTVLELAQAHLRPVAGRDVQITIEIRDMDRGQYRKTVVSA